MAEKQAKTPEGQPEGEQQQAAPPEAPDNAAIRQMRAEIERSQAEAREAREQLKLLNTKLTERQRAEMTEQERLRAELEETRQIAAQAEQARDELGRWQSWAKADYDSELAKVADGEDRETLRRMSATGDWRERLETLRGARTMLSQKLAVQRELEKAKADLEKAQQQSAFGTRTQPLAARPTQPSAPPERKFDPKNVPSWDQVLKPAYKPRSRTEQTE